MKHNMHDKDVMQHNEDSATCETDTSNNRTVPSEIKWLRPETTHNISMILMY